MTPIHTFQKDPDAVLDYGVDWGDWLGTDTLATSAWEVPAGIAKDTDTHDAKSTKVWLSGGTAGQRYMLTNRVTTAGGRTDERTVRVDVNNR